MGIRLLGRLKKLKAPPGLQGEIDRPQAALTGADQISGNIQPPSSTAAVRCICPT